jgi:hypothetical protein
MSGRTEELRAVRVIDFTGWEGLTIRELRMLKLIDRIHPSRTSYRRVIWKIHGLAVTTLGW